MRLRFRKKRERAFARSLSIVRRIRTQCLVLGQDEAEQDVGQNDGAARAKRKQHGERANEIRGGVQTVGDATAYATEDFVARLATNTRLSASDKNNRQHGEKNES